jgi:hypothetical protein
MDNKLSHEAFELLEFLVAHKETFTKNFSAGTISHWKSRLRANYINPLLEELLSFKLIKK